MSFAVAAHSDPALRSASASTAGESADCKTPLHAEFLASDMSKLDDFFLEIDHLCEEICGSDLNEVCASPPTIFGEDAEERIQIHAEIRGKFHGQPTDDHLVRLSSLRRSFSGELPTSLKVCR
ncbi:hypothetical protein T484DRAFT_1896996 [Baffinella frigidus]|nr:hypothetical protein T484DRAFT_1896996 [Cryptophyta sp. CCMP2293]